MSTPVVLYELSVPMFIRNLTSLKNFLKKGEKWCEENNVFKEKLLEGRIHEDMRTLIFQVQTCSNGPKMMLKRMAILEDLPTFEDKEKTFPELYARIDQTIDLLKSAKPAAFEGKETMEVAFQAGGGEVKFTGLTYLQHFALPNFFFHTTTAYNILRQAGVPVGKFDFLGKGQ